ncbi:MAG: flagellar biosynthetic protein FliO [Tistlia sp.]|uniref:FliO/MopB family protein n=1 Tax=Tistlia sp. TaxID=3057121 RepID=UPI0034A3D94E
MDLSGYLQFVAALALVLGLIGALAWLVRRSGVAGNLMPTSARKGEGRRLGVVEVLSLDPRRKLALVRCDGREHLLLLNQGPAPDLMIATTGGPEAGREEPAEPAAPPAAPDFATTLEQSR